VRKRNVDMGSSAKPTSKKTKSKLKAPSSLSFEEAVAELEAIIERMEGGEVGLEESLEAHRRGETLIVRCQAVLDKAQQSLQQVTPETPGRSDTASAK
jgi:exodeoxyribonuclease VII small subunit